MPDWQKLVEQRLARLRLAAPTRREVWSELADHLQDRYEHLLTSGVSEEDAEQQTLACISDWESLRRAVTRERRRVMTTFGKQFILPSGLAFALASVALAVEIRFGSRPDVWNVHGADLVFYHFWPVALFVIGGLASFSSMRAGAGRAKRFLVALTPSLYMLGLMLSVLVFALLLHMLKGVNPEPRFIFWGFLTGIANWVALPALPLLCGALPFLRQPMENNLGN